MLKSLDKAALHNLHEWLPKVNSVMLHRQFADGYRTAKLLADVFPHLVDLEEFKPRSSFAKKMRNWLMINNQVLAELDLTLPDHILFELAKGTPGYIERLLLDIRKKATLIWGEDPDNDNVAVLTVARQDGDDKIETTIEEMIEYSIYKEAKNRIDERHRELAAEEELIKELKKKVKLEAIRREEVHKHLARANARLASLQRNT